MEFELGDEIPPVCLGLSQVSGRVILQGKNSDEKLLLMTHTDSNNWWETRTMSSGVETIRFVPAVRS